MGPKAKGATRAETDAQGARQLGLALPQESVTAPNRGLLGGTPLAEPRSETRELVPTAPTAVAPRPPVAVESAPPTPRVLGVSELVRAARLTLENYFGEVRVEGEVCAFKRSGPGHLYFTLKDSDANLDCVMYSREASRLRFKVEDGMAVRLRGRLTIYEGRGKFQMTVVAIEPTGAGALAIAFEQLKQKLQAEGLFAADRKRKLPFLPRRIGVVTSPQGAVIRDIIRVAHRRFPVAILLAPTPVQGPGAAAGIVAGLERLCRVPDVDVVILARGGGSAEDLWCFNEEALARAIAASPRPVISAVGHETDFTISDFVADVRAPTPSAAAELAVPVLSELRTTLAGLGQRAARGATAHLRQQRLVVERIRARLGDPRRLVDERRQRIDDLQTRAQRATARRLTRLRAELTAAEVALSKAHPHRRIAAQRAALRELAQRLDTAGRRELRRRREPLTALEHKLHALSPRRVLDRGYSLTFGPDGHLLTDAATVAPGAAVRIALQKGELAATVTGVAPSEKESD
jgi:exodeoxyribonuclease VII large subunit